MPEILTFNQQRLNALLEPHRATARVKARFIRPFAGGQPAKEDGLRAFIQHHLGVLPDDPRFQEIFDRISKEEIGERETTPAEGEVKTEDVYQVNIIRRGEHGPYISEHQIKALIKQAASRMNLFVQKRGSKGDVAEMGTVVAAGASLQSPDRPWEIYLRNNGAAAGTHFDVLNGSVSTPAGKKSIQHHTQVSEEGAEFEFEVRWPAGKIKPEDMALIMAAATQIGLGSCLSLGYGRFEVVEMTCEGMTKPKKDEAA